MKKILLLLLLFGCEANAQGTIEFYLYASELRSDTRRDVNGQAVCIVGDTLKPTSYGGVFKLCDTCYSPTLWVDDSSNVFVFNISAGLVWYRVKTYPTFKTITDALNYIPIGWADTSTRVATKTNVSAKQDFIPTGTTSQYYRGDKTWQTMPSSKYLASFAISGAVNKIITAYMNNGDTVQTPVMKIPVTYSGTTNSSGIYAVTFPTAYSVAPNIQANVVGGNNKWTLIPSVTTTGFSIYVQNRVDVLGLLPSYTNVNGATIDVVITEK